MNLIPESRPLRILLILAILGLGWLLVLFLDSDRALRLRQEELVEWARTGSPSQFTDDFAAPDYHDQWGHTIEEVVLTARGIRMAHPDMTVTAGDATIKRDGDSAVITQRITVTGAGERVDTDFHFTWKKQNFWPWSWKLQEATAPGM